MQKEEIVERKKLLQREERDWESARKLCCKYEKEGGVLQGRGVAEGTWVLLVFQRECDGNFKGDGKVNLVQRKCCKMTEVVTVWRIRCQHK